MRRLKAEDWELGLSSADDERSDWADDRVESNELYREAIMMCVCVCE